MKDMSGHNTRALEHLNFKNKKYLSYLKVLDNEHSASVDVEQNFSSVAISCLQVLSASSYWNDSFSSPPDSMKWRPFA